MNEVRGWLAASLANAGKIEEASAMLESFIQVAQSEMPVPLPKQLAAWSDYWRGAIPYRNASDREHLFSALRKAGMPD
jgi:hypothetical protein